ADAAGQGHAASPARAARAVAAEARGLAGGSTARATLPRSVESPRTPRTPRSEIGKVGSDALAGERTNCPRASRNQSFQLPLPWRSWRPCRRDDPALDARAGRGCRRRLLPTRPRVRQRVAGHARCGVGMAAVVVAGRADRRCGRSDEMRSGAVKLTLMCK